jgi:two-component system invasion response regulator UvrY
MIRILVADDHAIIRQGLTFFINTIVADAVIDEAWDGLSAMERISQHEYRLIILDVNMPNTDCFELVSTIISNNPDANILVFSMYPQFRYAHRFLQLGAKCYLTKDAPSTELETAIHTLLDNKRYISAETGKAIAAEGVIPTNNPFDILSIREFQVVQFIIEGKSVSDIKHSLKIKNSTISTYKGRIFEKLQCSNVIQLTELARLYNI